METEIILSKFTGTWVRALTTFSLEVVIYCSNVMHSSTCYSLVIPGSPALFHVLQDCRFQVWVKRFESLHHFILVSILRCVKSTCIFTVLQELLELFVSK